MGLKIGDNVYLPFKVDGIHGNIVKLNNDSIGDIFHHEKNVSKEIVSITKKVPQVAIDYYNFYKNDLTSFEEWFGDFYSADFLEQFPRGSELAKWLYDNDDQTNIEHELALATLIVYGENAVEIIKEPEYKVYMNNAHEGFSQLKLDDKGEWYFGSINNSYGYKVKFTQEKLKEMGLEDVFTSSIFKVEKVI